MPCPKIRSKSIVPLQSSLWFQLPSRPSQLQPGAPQPLGWLPGFPHQLNSPMPQKSKTSKTHWWLPGQRNVCVCAFNPEGLKIFQIKCHQHLHAPPYIDGQCEHAKIRLESSSSSPEAVAAFKKPRSNSWQDAGWSEHWTWSILQYHVTAVTVLT